MEITKWLSRFWQRRKPLEKEQYVWAFAFVIATIRCNTTPLVATRGVNITTIKTKK